jgi:hypothetical protein
MEENKAQICGRKGFNQFGLLCTPYCLREEVPSRDCGGYGEVPGKYVGLCGCTYVGCCKYGESLYDRPEIE